MSAPGASGGAFSGVVMHYGPVPPSGGPRRKAYLDENGRASLNRAESRLAEALAILSDVPAPIPVLPFPLVNPDAVERRAVQLAMRRAWIDYLGHADARTLEAVRPLIKDAVSASVGALNFLEDHALREDAHAAIHRTAFVSNGLFGCPFEVRDGQYFSACPTHLSHLRVGLSGGVIGEFVCSVCDVSFEDCDHHPGQSYDKIAARDSDGTCNICYGSGCEHSAGEVIQVQAHGVARSLEADHVAFVARPRYPQARLTEVSFDPGPQADDPDFERMVELGYVHCDKDLGPCSGLQDQADWVMEAVVER